MERLNSSDLSLLLPLHELLSMCAINPGTVSLLRQSVAGTRPRRSARRAARRAPTWRATAGTTDGFHPRTQYRGIGVAYLPIVSSNLIGARRVSSSKSTPTNSRNSAAAVRFSRYPRSTLTTAPYVCEQAKHSPAADTNSLTTSPSVVRRCVMIGLPQPEQMRISSGEGASENGCEGRAPRGGNNDSWCGLRFTIARRRFCRVVSAAIGQPLRRSQRVHRGKGCNELSARQSIAPVKVHRTVDKVLFPRSRVRGRASSTSQQGSRVYSCRFSASRPRGLALAARFWVRGSGSSVSMDGRFETGEIGPARATVTRLLSRARRGWRGCLHLFRHTLFQ